MARAARATEVACDSRKQKSYRVNRPFSFRRYVVEKKYLGKTGKILQHESPWQGREERERNVVFVVVVFLCLIH